jgi:hypothetical protein
VIHDEFSHSSYDKSLIFVKLGGSISFGLNGTL